MRIQESSLSSFAAGPDSCFREFHSSVTLGVFVSFLIFYEFLALYATSRDVICTYVYTILAPKS